MADTGKKRKRGVLLKRILCILLVLVLVCAGGFWLYVRDFYHADSRAAEALAGDETVTVETPEKGMTVFSPGGRPECGLIFYPGAKVEYAAYAPLMKACARQGILCVLLKMPCNLAVLDMDAAEGIPDQFPDISTWLLAGHSLGGAMAASFAAENADMLDGLVLLAAYSTADLKGTGLSVLSVRGSEDGVLNMEKYEACRSSLPDDAVETVIEGGCHAGFGSYGPQKGDGTPAISGEEQTEQTARAIADFAEGLAG